MIKNMSALFILMFSAQLLGSEFEASICKLTNGDFGVIPINEHLCLSPLFDDLVTQNDFTNLTPQDGLTFTGTRLSTYDIRIESISTVRLKKLIGKWKDFSGRYYNFVDHLTVAVYDPHITGPNKGEILNYELYPNTPKRWGISFNNRSISRVGSLRQYTDLANRLRFEICLYSGPTSRDSSCTTLGKIKN